VTYVCPPTRSAADDGFKAASRPGRSPISSSSVLVGEDRDGVRTTGRDSRGSRTVFPLHRCPRDRARLTPIRTHEVLMAALRSLDYEPSPVPHGRHASQEAEVVREERRRDRAALIADLESQQPDMFEAPANPWSDSIGREY
jgi:hypothetical protein